LDISIIIFIISASLGMLLEAEVMAADPLSVVVLVLVPGGSTGLGAVLGELPPVCANALESEVTIAIPKKTVANRVGRSFIGRDCVLNRDCPSSLMLLVIAVHHAAAGTLAIAVQPSHKATARQAIAATWIDLDPLLFGAEPRATI
jgi:hypothetical protein